MRAVRFASFGDPAEVLTVEDQPITAPGPGQVLLRMRVRPINPSDLFAIRGSYGVLPRLPATPGMEGAGVVDALGFGVKGFAVGQLVATMGVGGTWQEYMVVHSSALLPVPAGLSERQAAMLLVNPTSAWLLLHEVLRVEPEAWVLQNAANSAVGRFVIQLARRSGFRTINLVRRHDLADELRAEGADAVICEDDEDVLGQVAALTGPRGVRYALELGLRPERLAPGPGPRPPRHAGRLRGDQRAAAHHRPGCPAVPRGVCAWLVALTLVPHRHACAAVGHLRRDHPPGGRWHPARPDRCRVSA